MKVRTGFVSNSSSCSFVVIQGDQPSKALMRAYMDRDFPKHAEITINTNLGAQTGFWGWREKYYDFGSKWNFVWAQAMYARIYDEDNRLQYFKMLDSLCKEFGRRLKKMTKEEWQAASWRDDIGIDHQSACFEDTSQTDKIFRDLRRFLFSPESYVALSRDEDALYDYEDLEGSFQKMMRQDGATIIHDTVPKLESKA